MHGKKFLVREVYYGSGRLQPLSASGFSSRVGAGPIGDGGAPEHLGGRTSQLQRDRHFDYGHANVTETEAGRRADAATPRSLEFAFGRILEARLSLAALGARDGTPVRFQFSLWQGGLPMDAVPQQGWIEMPTTEPADWQV